MGLFGFLNQPESFQKRVEKIEGVSVTLENGCRFIHCSSSVSSEQIQLLLYLLKKEKMDFSLYDPLYPSPSDPGAYMSYSRHGALQDCWSMTIGNHGWTGGIYQIEEKNVLQQITDLAQKKLLEPAQVDNVTFFSRLEPETANRNEDQNIKIHQIHL